MDNQCRISFIKLLFFVFNFLICIFGALICAFSLWANLDDDFGQHFSDFVRQIDGGDVKLLNEVSKYQASMWIFVAVGALLFFVGFFGCCGAALESSVLLGLFIFVVLVLMFVELGTTIFAMTNRHEFVSTIQQVLEKSSITAKLRKNLKPIQDIFQCCGATAKTQNLYISDGLCGVVPIRHTDNCFDRLSHMINSWGESIVITSFILIAIENLAISFSFILYRASRYAQYTPYYSSQ